MEFLKKDLQEFTNVMKEDTTKAAVDVKKQLTVSRIIFRMWQQDPFLVIYDTK